MTLAHPAAATLHPLIVRLIETNDYPWLDGEATGEGPAGVRLLFLPAHGRAHVETADIAVVLPELVAALRADGGAVAGPTCERHLRDALGGIALPAIVVLKDGAPVGSLSRMRDWDEFLDRLAPLVAAARDGSPFAAAPPSTALS